MEMQIYEKVREFVKTENMFRNVSAVSAAVSGGGDSMAMLDILLRLREESGFLLRVVHVNHGIRGKDAGEDQKLVETFCREKGIVCASYFRDVPALSGMRGSGLEETGRAVRQEIFRQEREILQKMTAGEGKAVTAVAHNRNDLAETMLHHLARGPGLRGLAAVRPAGGDLVRPVLCLERSEIDRYLAERSVPFATDATNYDDDYTRNRIRHHILPELEREINPKAVRHMAETSGILGMAEEYLENKGKELLKTVKRENGCFVFTDDFFRRETILQTYALMDAMELTGGKRKDITLLHVRSVLGLWKKKTGSAASLPYGMEAVRGYGGVLLRKKKKETGTVSLPAEQEWELPVQGRLECAWGIFETEVFPYCGQKILEKKYTKWLDCDKIKYGLTVRTRKSGDYLVINGSGNKKKLTRCMIDDKIPEEVRDSIPLVTAGGEVLWIVGGRMNTGCGITPDTKRVLQIEYHGEKAEQTQSVREYRAKGGKSDE